MPAQLRKAYGEILAQLGKEYKDFVVFVADTGDGTGAGTFLKAFPERSFDFGIAEQNMISVAAGFSTVGIMPIVNTYGVFATARVADQVRNSVCYPKFNVKIVASHVGIDAGADGASHQSVEDLAIMRAIPNMIILIPADRIELEAMLRFLLQYHGPAYMRTTRADMPSVNSRDYVYRLGKATVLREGKDVTILAIGVMVPKALEAAKRLDKRGVFSEVINCSTLKPLARETIVESVRKTGAAVTVEDHNIINGLGSAISELISREYPIPIEFIGIQDHFGESGKEDELYVKYGMSEEHIVEAACRAINRKS